MLGCQKSIDPNTFHQEFVSAVFFPIILGGIQRVDQPIFWACLAQLPALSFGLMAHKASSLVEGNGTKPWPFPGICAASDGGDLLIITIIIISSSSSSIMIIINCYDYWYYYYSYHYY
jgi:hypothetical protein